jgi:integrase
MPKKRKQDQDGLYRRTDSPKWWATYTDARGKRTRRSTGTGDRKEASTILAQWRLEAHHEKQRGEQGRWTFDEMMLAYLDGPSTEKRCDRDKYLAQHLYRHFTGHELASLSGIDVNRYIAERRSAGAAPATINRELGLLSSAINYAPRELEWNIPNPVQGRKLQAPEARVRWISQEEASSLILAAESEPTAPHLPDFIRLALNTGCRRDEMLRMEWSRVDLQGRLMHLEGHHTKSGRRRSIPLNDVARAAIVNRARFRAQHCPDSPWLFCREDGSRIGTVRRSFGTACRRAGIEDFHIHDLRHTCAAWLVTAGVPLPEIRDLLGHASVTMTEKYAHLSPDRVRSAVEVLDQQQASASRSASRYPRLIEGA